MKNRYKIFTSLSKFLFLLITSIALLQTTSYSSTRQTYDEQNGDWSAQHVTLVNTTEADLMVRTGDIDNLGFGWADNFNPFSGESTGAHSYPWTPDTADATGTDRIMVVSSYNGSPPHGEDGYTYSTSRPENLPRPIVLNYSLNGINVKSATLQIFVDDFQATTWGADYFVSINGVNIPGIAKMVNSLVQTGPIGKLINVTVPQEYLYLIERDSLSILFDDATTGAGDGYAIDFVKLLINTKKYEFTAKVYGYITNPKTGDTIENATISTSGIDSTTSDSNGYYILDNLPAGITSFSVMKTAYDTTTILLDLSSGDSVRQDFQIKRSKIIFSTTAGGYWKDVATWVGGVVPNSTNNVIINGTVVLDGYGNECNDLTINAGDTLHNISTSSNNLKIHGNIVNNGTVLTVSSYTLYPYKDIINNGTWNTYNVKLAYGEQDETIVVKGSFKSSLFSFSANVKGATSYKWYKNGQLISGATSSRYYIRTDEDYFGEYYCLTDAGNSRKITISNDSTSGGTLLKENFDGEVFPPNGWTQKITNTSNTWKKGNPASHPFTNIDPTNVYSAICPYVSENQDEWLITPSVALPAGTISLEFYAGYNSTWLSNATVKLNISTDGGANWTKLGEADNDGKSWEWRKVTVDLSEYAGQTIMLAWQYVGNDGDLMAIDNVEITQGTTGIDDNKAVIDQLLSQNYPNPFSIQTHIPFKLDKKSNVRLVIYNSLGQKVAEPVSGTLNAGNHKVTFDASGLQPGIYFYRLVVDGAAATRRMIIMK